jgi:hypothetical protein
MILILSDTSDVTTYHVAKWLEYYGKEVCIITDEDHIRIVQITNDDMILEADGRTIDLKDVTAYWYRRGAIVIADSTAWKNYPADIQDELRGETATITEIIHRRLASVKSLGMIYNADLNRVLCMDMAREEGLHTPAYCICSSKSTLQVFRDMHVKIVSKPVRN